MRKTLRQKIREVQRRTGIGWGVVEQDYVLTRMLFGISNVPKLRTYLVFKGGTALKKCYFHNYRFSQDLDFSVQGENPSLDEIEALISQACQHAEGDLTLECRRYEERDPHPQNQFAFLIHAQLPWQREPLTRVKIEITTQELLLRPPKEKAILHDYENELDTTISVYSLEEIVAEKIRSILQFSKKLHERGWGRSRVRDYYDLWRILTDYQDQLETSELLKLIDEKCSSKNVSFSSIDDLFTEQLMLHLNEWKRWLSPMVPSLPEKDMVITKLRRQLEDLLT